MSGDQLNLDDVLRRAEDGARDDSLYFTRMEVLTADVPELVAEVRRLRAKVERVEATMPRAYPGNAIEYGGMVHYVDDDHKTHHPDVTCPCSPTPVWVPRP